MTTLNFVWTTSRGRETYGYNICTLWVDGRRVARCNGGGYDMKGTSLGIWIGRAYADRLLRLTAADMPAQSHWQRAKKPRQICTNVACVVDNVKDGDDDSIYAPYEADVCPHCGGQLRIDHRDGKRIEDGRYFYGLTFHNPNYDPGKAVIGTDCNDRTLGGPSEGETVAQAEAAGKSFGLERYQAIYTASSKVPTDRHTIPQIDGGCGFSSVETIMKAIGLTLQWVNTRSKKTDVYILHDAQAEQVAA